MWAHFNDDIACDIVAVEVCGTIQNLNDKRSRYIPGSRSLVLECSEAWLKEDVSVQKGGRIERWKAAGSWQAEPFGNIRIPIRHLRVLYGIPNSIYMKWSREHSPTGYEFFCPHSSLQTYNSQAMQRFLRQMSIESQFRA
jgi:hypothetical protein